MESSSQVHLSANIERSPYKMSPRYTKSSTRFTWENDSGGSMKVFRTGPSPLLGLLFSFFWASFLLSFLWHLLGPFVHHPVETSNKKLHSWPRRPLLYLSSGSKQGSRTNVGLNIVMLEQSLCVIAAIAEYDTLPASTLHHLSLRLRPQLTLKFLKVLKNSLTTILRLLWSSVARAVPPSSHGCTS